MSPAVQGSFTRVISGTHGCKQFWCPTARLLARFQVRSGEPRRRVVATMAPTAVQAHRGSPDPAAGIRREHPRGLPPGPRLGADGVELDVRLTGGRRPGRPPRSGRRRASGTVSRAGRRRSPRRASPCSPRPSTPAAGSMVNIEIKNLPGEPGFDPDERLARAGGRPGGEPRAGRRAWSSRRSGPAPLEAVRRRRPRAGHRAAPGLVVRPAAGRGRRRRPRVPGPPPPPRPGHGGPGRRGPRGRAGRRRLDGQRPGRPGAARWRPAWTRSSPTTWPWPWHAGPA